MKFSIIMPTYNRAYTLELAINSVLRQTYTDFELIISDDGSTDLTENIISPYLSDSRIRYFKSEKNGGVNVARNLALSKVADDSDWITFLDSDDEFYPSALDIMKTSISSNETFNYFRFATIYDTGKTLCSLPNKKYVACYTDYLKGVIPEGDWVVAFNRKVLERGFTFENSLNGFEGISWLDLSKIEDVFYENKHVLEIHAQNQDSLLRPTIKDFKYYVNIKKGLEMYFDKFGDDLEFYNKKIYAQRLYALGNVNLIMGERRQGIKNTINAIRLDPINRRAIRNLFSFIRRIVN